MTKARLTYGDGWLECEVPGDVKVLRPAYSATARDEGALVNEALEDPIGAPPLEELARRRRRAIILIACRTRRSGSHIFLPEIVRRLNAAGLSDDRILVDAATGTHDNWRACAAPRNRSARCC